MRQITNYPQPANPASPGRTRWGRNRLRRTFVAIVAGLAGLAGGPALAAVTSRPALAAPNTLNGPVWPFGPIQNVVIHNLYMDTNWDAHNPANMRRATIDDFTTQLLGTGYFSKATQYGVASASFTGSDQAIAACPPPGPTFDYFALSSWVLCEKHSLPSSSTNNVNLWQVYVPANAGLNMQISWPWGGSWQLSTSCQGWDGFHAQTLPSVVPPDVPQTFGAVFTGCQPGGLNATTDISSHELIEAATDPVPGTGWYDHSLGLNGEAGDVCETGNPPFGFIAGGSYEIASYYSNADGGCVAPGNGGARCCIPPVQVGVPSVIGDAPQSAAAVLRSAGFGVSISSIVDRTCNNIGYVTSQLPRGGSAAPKGSNVTIWVGVRPPTPCP